MYIFLYPHHVTISWEADPTCSQAVTWRTADTVRNSYVEYCEAAPTPFFRERVQRLRAQTEYATARSPDSLTRHWRLNFTFPQNGPPGQEEETYYADYNNVRIISLNLCRYPIDKKGTKDMLEWLEARLKQGVHRWSDHE